MPQRAHFGPELVEVLQDTACEVSPIHVRPLPARRALPKVRAFVDVVAAELEGAGAGREAPSEAVATAGSRS